MSVKDQIQELKELGLKGSLFRIGWELKMRINWFQTQVGELPKIDNCNLNSLWIEQLPFAKPEIVAKQAQKYIPTENLSRLLKIANDATLGKILCFSRWVGDFGDPIDWYLNPINKLKWAADINWSKALREESRVGDVKLTWEVGRFPQAFHIARAAVFLDKSKGAIFASALKSQIESFINVTPFQQAIHWHSSQEIVFRLVTWLFALKALLKDYVDEPFTHKIANQLLAAAIHIEQNISYARYAVYNNHLLSEALGLLIVGKLFPEINHSKRWTNLAVDILTEQAERQFYKDGAYIQQSHNYHRVALYDILLACLFMKKDVPKSWYKALERSLVFLLSHQNPIDGRLPNYGANDGALPLILSTCDYADFRPIMQTLSIMLNSERLYTEGPWDEEVSWLLGVNLQDYPLNQYKAKSMSFSQTGYHVMQGNKKGHFASFRCGTIKDRFSQIDMLHLDVWWKGLNVLVDSGSYLYNGLADWHNHFMSTSSHNTVVVDNHNQMKHYRRFKCLYWTKAKLLEFKDTKKYTLCAGEHYGFQKYSGNVVHRRSIIFFKDDLWIVVDQIYGQGCHSVELNWLCGDFPFVLNDNKLSLKTNEGDFSIEVYDSEGKVLTAKVVLGQENPPKGWLSRYYGEKIAVPAFFVKKQSELPLVFVSVLGNNYQKVSFDKGVWSVKDFNFTIDDKLIVLDL